MLQRVRFLPLASTVTASSNSSISQPISLNLAVIESRCLGVIFLTVTLPLVAAAAAIYVPASIWSGIIE